MDVSDSVWWREVCAESESAYEPVEKLSIRFNERLKQDGLDESEHDVLSALAMVSSATLEPENFNEPFVPAIVMDGRRSALPSDLTDDQIRLLADLAPSIGHAGLRARVADAVWTRDRSRRDLLDLAVDAYRSIPLDEQAWVRGGQEAWRRAFELVARRKDKDRHREMNQLLRARLDATDAAAFAVVGQAAMLREFGKGAADARRATAAQLSMLAAKASSPRLARGLELEAANWTAGVDEEARNACRERAARTFLTEADVHAQGMGDSRALAEAVHLEQALAMLLTLPRKYRIGHGLDSEIDSIRKRLQHAREVSLEEMVRVTSDPVDLTDGVSWARATVAGHETPWEALVAFVTSVPAVDAAEVLANAASVLNETVVTQLFGATTLAGDGRKVGHRTGGTDARDSAIDAEADRNVDMRAALVAHLLLPAMDVLVIEHHVDRSFLVMLCRESPLVPDGHEQLWGAALALGFSGDFGIATPILVSQLEHAVRVLLKAHGVYTLSVDSETGVEAEKTFGVLLDMPEAARIFGDGVVLELKALLLKQAGPNLRNDAAHGLLGDADAWSYTSAYVWWMCLRLVLTPLIVAQGDTTQP